MEPHAATVERPTDRELQVRVLSALDCEHVDRAAVGVTVCCGVVTLQGRVQSRRQAWLAAQAVYATPGVLGIANELHEEKDRRDRDSVLAESAVKALASQRVVAPNTVKVVVSAGYITLCGEVADLRERDAAERAVSALGGVRGVWNALKVLQAAARPT
jgi:osmotically-inducible protein OsmY